MAEFMDVINENNEVIRAAARAEIKQKNLLHSGVIIFLFNSKGELFVHQRSKGKKMFPLRWDIAVGGGVKAGETYKEAALRELFEETGIKAQLHLLGLYRHKSRIDNYLSQIYTCQTAAQPKPSKKEISQWLWLNTKLLKKHTRQHKHCPDSLHIYKKFLTGISE